MLETQEKIIVKRGILHVFGLVWDCGSTIETKGLV